MGMRILVIEDEHKLANAIKRGLEQESYAVDVSYDSDSGFTMATTKQYDLIIVDRVLPGKYKGLQIVQEMRKAKIHTPVLVLNTKEAARNKTESLDSEADDYLTKPFAFSELMTRVRSLTRGPEQQNDTKLVYKDLTLDPSNYTVSRGKTPIELTHREFALLEYLIRNPGRVLTKDMITQHVWDYNADILPNTVEVYMGYIRNKVEKPFGQPTLIRTRRGFGYVFGES
jgi:DNA-binding response OmpR family regulator